MTSLFQNRFNKAQYDEKFIEITELYYNLIYKYSLVCLYFDKGSSEECTQEVFMILYENLRKIKEFTHIKSWLYQTANNIIKRYKKEKYNQNKRMVSLDIQDEMSIYLKYDENFDSVFEIDENKYTTRILNSLSFEEQELYTNYFRNKATVPELTSLLNISETAVTTRIYRLKLKIKKTTHDIIEREINIPR